MNQLVVTSNEPDKHSELEIERLPDLVTERTLATWLRVDRKTIWRWVSAGTFPRPFKISGAKSQSYWLADEVAGWVLAKYRAAQQQAA